MNTLIVIAGASQLVLAAASLAIPRVLRWREDLATLAPINRQVFWTYAGYIWATNVCFGLVSVLAPGLLLSDALLARLVCGYIATYWGARLLLEIFYMDRVPGQRLAEAVLLILFASLTVVYGAGAVR